MISLDHHFDRIFDRFTELKNEEEHIEELTIALIAGKEITNNHESKYQSDFREYMDVWFDIPDGVTECASKGEWIKMAKMIEQATYECCDRFIKEECDKPLEWYAV